MWLLRLETEDSEEHFFLYENKPGDGQISDKIRLALSEWGDVDESEWANLCHVSLFKLEVE